LSNEYSILKTKVRDKPPDKTLTIDKMFVALNVSKLEYHQ